MSNRPFKDSFVSSERQPLLSPSSSPISAVSEEQVGCCKKWHTCQLSKAAIALIVFHAVVGASYATCMNGIMWLGYTSGNVSITVISAYLVFAIITLLSPLSGFLAYVCYGRYRVIHTGLGLMLGAFIVISFNAVFTMIYGYVILNFFAVNMFFDILTVVSYLMFIVGHASYQANFIQFGLDQLLEAPSTSLALFIHWVIWADSLGTFTIQVCFAVFFVQNRICSFCWL